MAAEQPEIAGLRDWLARRRGRLVGDVFVALGFFFFAERRHQRFKLGVGKSRQSEVEALAVQRMQFGREQILIPARVERELVAGNHVGTPLRRGQMPEHHHRHGIDSEPACRQQPAVAGDYHAFGVDQDRIGPAELDDRGGDLRDLVVRVRSGVARIGDQPVERPMLDRVGQSVRHLFRVERRTAAGVGNRGAPVTRRRLPGRRPKTPTVAAL